VKVGQLLDSLGIELDVDEADMVTDVIVLAKVVGDDGRVYLAMDASNERDGIMERGLLTEALAVIDRRRDDE